jgi:hypothetical protein
MGKAGGFYLFGTAGKTCFYLQRIGAGSQIWKKKNQLFGFYAGQVLYFVSFSAISTQ